jgi:hypothetical protein
MTLPPTCPVCRRTFDGVPEHVMLQHLVNNHPGDEETQELIDEEIVKAAYTECASWFDAEVSVDVDNAILTRRAVCGYCTLENPIKELVVVPTTAKAVFEGRETDANKPEGWRVPEDGCARESEVSES